MWLSPRLFGASAKIIQICVQIESPEFLYYCKTKSGIRQDYIQRQGGCVAGSLTANEFKVGKMRRQVRASF